MLGRKRNVLAGWTFYYGDRWWEIPMLHWALTFLVLGLIAALFGFTAIAGASIGIAKILFFVFLAMFAVMLLMGAARGRDPLL